MQLPYFTFEEYSQIVWALAKLDSPLVRGDAFLYHGLAHWPLRLEEAQNRDKRDLPRALGKNIAQLAFGYAKACHEKLPEEPSEAPASETLLAFTAALPIILKAVPQLAPQGLALLVWAFARMGAPPKIMDTLVWAIYPAVCSKLNRFQPTGLALMVYGLGLARFRHEPILDVLTGQCTARLRTFNGQVRPAIDARLIVCACSCQRVCHPGCTLSFWRMQRASDQVPVPCTRRKALACSEFTLMFEMCCASTTAHWPSPSCPSASEYS